MTHLTDDELLTAVEDEAAHAHHLDACATCRGRAQALREILGEARALDIPDPSPLFWDHFSSRVRAAVDDAGAPRSGWMLGWRAAALVSIALVVLALAATVDRWRPASDQAPTVAIADPGGPDDTNSAVQPVDDASWTLMTELAGELDWDEAGAAGLVAPPGSAERVLDNLSEMEEQALLDLLKQEMQTTANVL
jgi:hypothetical protein